MKKYLKYIVLACALTATPMTWAKQPTQTELTQQALAQNAWAQELKRINPQDYAYIERELSKSIEQAIKKLKQRKQTVTEEDVAEMLSQIYQQPKLMEIVSRYLSYYNKASDETVMKFFDGRVRIMNRLLAHNDTSCYDWLMQKPTAEVLTAYYELSLFNSVFLDILKTYDPNRILPSEQEIEPIFNMAYVVAIKQMNQPIDLNILNKSELSNSEKRQICELQRNFETHLLYNREVNVLRLLVDFQKP